MTTVFHWVLAVVLCTSSASIMPNPIGVTIPSGDIYVETDDTLEITCVLYEKPTEKDLKFTCDECDISPYVKRINATAIALRIKNPKTQSQTYRCLQGDQIVDENFVFVAVKPSDINCVSYNYDRLNCSFKSSEMPSNTTFEAKYELRGYRHNNRFWTTLDNVTYVDNQGYYFVLDDSTTLQYRFGYEEFNLLVKVTIEFPKSKRIIEYVLNATYNAAKHVIPGAATNLEVREITSRSIQIGYNLSKKMIYVDYPLEHMIVWSCQIGRKTWNDKATFNTTSKSVTYTITDLPYAYALCNVSVFLKVSQAAFDHMWSSNATIEAVRTGSVVPENPPQILQGSFQIFKNSNETYNAVIYWMEIPEESRGGPNFVYDIKIANNSKHLEVEDTYALLKNLNSSVDTSIEIRSKNREGVSADKSVIALPKNAAITKLESFTQWTNASGVTYLSWQTPKSARDITKEFLVFTCDDWSEQTHICKGQLKTVDAKKSPKGNYYEVHRNLTEETKYGVAFKTPQNWTGVFWSKCSIKDSAHRGLPPPQIRPSIATAGPSKIGLNWTLNCEDMVAPITGYVVNYCKKSRNAQEECDGKVRNITIEGDTTRGNCEIEDLEDNTQYLVWISTTTLFGKQQKSEKLTYDNRKSQFDSMLVYLTIPAGIIFLILMAISSKLLYKKLSACWDVRITMPPGLQSGTYDGDSNEKRFQWIRWSVGAKMHEVIPKNKEKVAPAKLTTEASEVSLQLSIESQRDNLNVIAKPEVPPRSYVIVSDVEEGIRRNSRESLEESKPYIQIGLDSREPEQCLTPISIGDEDFSHNYARSCIIPDLLKQSAVTENEVPPPPYVTLGEMDKKEEDETSHTFPGEQEEPKTLNFEHSTHPYVTFNDFEKLNLANGFCTPYVPANDFPLGEEPSRAYVLAGVKSEEPEEVPLLPQPSRPPYVVLGTADRKTDLPRPYVTIGDLLGSSSSSRYSDTPA